EPVWIADGEHPIPNLRDAIGESDVWEIVAAVDFDQGDVGFRIGSDDPSLVCFLGVRLDLDGLAVAHDVGVGYHIAVGRNEEARTLCERELGMAAAIREIRCSELAERRGPGERGGAFLLTLVVLTPLLCVRLFVGYPP